MTTDRFMPEGSLAFPDAIALVAERRFAAVGARGHEQLALRAAMARMKPPLRATLTVPASGDGAPMDLADLQRKVAATREAQRWLRARLVSGEVKGVFVSRTGGLIDIPDAWWTGRAFDEVALAGSPRDGLLHAGIWHQGHVVVAEAALDQAIARDKAGALPAPTAEPVPHQNRGGRPKEYDYEWLSLEVASIYFNEAQPPKTRAGLVAALQERYDARFGVMPDESTLKRFVRKAFAHLGLDE
jgi:hypothetical protein